jgi:hypothetical protein
MNPQKFRNSAGKPSETAETVAARCSTRHCHWRRVGSRAAADEGKKSVDRERLLLLYLPTPSVRVTTTCNKGKNAQTTVDFYFSFFFRSVLGLLSFVFGSLFFPSSGGGSDGCRSSGGHSRGWICQCLKASVWRRT